MNPSPGEGAPFSQGTIALIVNSLLEEFPARAVYFLNREGQWQKDPMTWRDRVAHELFYQLKLGGKERIQELTKVIHYFLSRNDVFLLIRKIGLALRQQDFMMGWPHLAGERDGGVKPSIISLQEINPCLRESLLLFWETLFGLIERQSFLLIAEAPFPEWDVQARTLRENFRSKLLEFDARLNSFLSAEEKTFFQATSASLQNSLADLVNPVSQLMAEEGRITAEVEKLLEKLESSPEKEEIYAAIIDRIQPPMGIVTNLSPSLFYPCLRLLLDPRIDVASGIQYMASVGLSIFRDPRSADYLLRALERFPVSCTKVRENIIYTLGNLKEELAVPLIARVLDEPDVLSEGKPGEVKPCLLREQKEEAIWALGKIGLAAARVIPSLVPYTEHHSARLKTYLAWTLGEIGRAQKEKTGGVSADILIALLKLLQEKNKEVFEEAVSGLKKIQMPEFIHSLYLYHVGAISILGLKPAERGLNELSATLNYLLATKKRTVMAVTGDSGTGKTYFCQAIGGGFAGLKPEEILYLMRDSKRGQKIFNRLLGLSWLKRYIDPAYYQDYPFSEDQDDPEVFFQEFMEENASKRLIILDGCRDRHYFQRVVDLFYQHGELDVVVNFRSNFSTRRLNLEERESALESVKLHLAFLEEPVLEDTYFYQEGMAILYDLDNSISSRLNQEETRELFSRRRIPSWGEFIRLGQFSPTEEISPCSEEKFSLQEEAFDLAEETWPESHIRLFSAEEEILKPLLNENLGEEPNLLLTVPLPGLRPNSIRFYAQDQVAGIGDEGGVFVFTFIDNRLFHTWLEDKIIAFTLLGRTFFLQTERLGLISLSLERNEIITHAWPGPPAVLMASCPPDHLFTAHQDGSLYGWNFREKKIFRLEPNFGPISSLAVGPTGKVYLAVGREVGRLDLEKKKIQKGVIPGGEVKLLRPYLSGKILAITGENDRAPWGCKILNLDKGEAKSVFLRHPEEIGGAQVVPDGRIAMSWQEKRNQGDERFHSLVILSPEGGHYLLARVNKKECKIKDFLLLGPRIITCGLEADTSGFLRIWGGEFLVKAELSKLRIKPL